MIFINKYIILHGKIFFIIDIIIFFLYKTRKILTNLKNSIFNIQFF